MLGTQAYKGTHTRNEKLYSCLRGARTRFRQCRGNNLWSSCNANFISSLKYQYGTSRHPATGKGHAPILGRQHFFVDSWSHAWHSWENTSRKKWIRILLPSAKRRSRPQEMNQAHLFSFLSLKLAPPQCTVNMRPRELRTDAGSSTMIPPEILELTSPTSLYNGSTGPLLSILLITTDTRDWVRAPVSNNLTPAATTYTKSTSPSGN